MSNDIGYGAQAIRAGDVKYQQSLVNLLKQAADNKPAPPQDSETTPAKPSDPQVGRNVDVSA